MSYGYAYDGRGLTYRPNPHHSFNKSAAFGFSRSRKYGRNAHHYNHPPATVEQAAEPVRPPNAHPEKLIELLKSSGEYDRLRKQIFARFQNSVIVILFHIFDLYLTSSRICERYFSAVWMV
ncbi:hypothetical protein FRC20_002085 [Serendipita sp. 405]|nr:hypothetical protein FRC20_002085 [Serendipita sp. 405]